MRLITRPPCLLPSTALERRTRLPYQPGVYYCLAWWMPWKVLYVGMSRNLNRRWNRTGEYTHHKLHILNRWPGIRIHYRVCPTELAAKRLEADEIRRFKPPLNRKLEPRVRDPIGDTFDFMVDSVYIALGMALLLILAARMLHG